MKARKWSREELVVAFFIAKWGKAYFYRGFNHPNRLDDVIESKVFSVQVSKFRFLMDLEGATIDDKMEEIKPVLKELKDKTITQVKDIVQIYLDSI